jgi:hypothetical protein
MTAENKTSERIRNSKMRYLFLRKYDRITKSRLKPVRTTTTMWYIPHKKGLYTHIHAYVKRELPLIHVRKYDC